MSASGIKPWQWVLMAVALVVLSVSLWRTIFSGDRVNLANKIYMVDLVSGELFVADVSGHRGVVIPARHPETDARTIIPVDIDASGTIIVSSRYREIAQYAITQGELTVNSAIDRTTWQVNTTLKQAKKYTNP